VNGGFDMVTFLKTALADAGIIIITFLLFTAVIPGDIRHKIWEKYISSFAKFVVYIFIATVVINLVTALIVYKIRYERYMNIIAPSVQSVLIGFVASCVPRRGFEDKKREELR
jgi:hypothetical protein